MKGEGAIGWNSTYNVSKFRDGMNHYWREYAKADSSSGEAMGLVVGKGGYAKAVAANVKARQEHAKRAQAAVMHITAQRDKLKREAQDGPCPDEYRPIVEQLFEAEHAKRAQAAV